MGYEVQLTQMLPGLTLPLSFQPFSPCKLYSFPQAAFFRVQETWPLKIQEPPTSQCPLLEGSKPCSLCGPKFKNPRKGSNWLSLGQLEVGPLVK